MIVLHDGDARSSLEHHSAVAIGVFDGLHRGHQRVIERLRALALEHDAVSTVVTFDPHPALVLNAQRAPRSISTIEQRLEGLEALGVEQVRVLGFDESLSQERAEDFVARVLVGELSANVIVVGEDFRFGRDREGDVTMLRALGTRYGFSVHEAPPYGDEHDGRWSSSIVRATLEEGDLERAARVLGRAFIVRGRVVRGDQRGTELGYPTANLALGARQQLPRAGIYAGAGHVGNRWWPAAISVGTRPQFYENGALLVEVYLVGFSGDLYDAVLDVAFLAHLRAEAKFDTLEELVAQIGRDAAASVEIFRNFSPASSVLLG